MKKECKIDGCETDYYAKNLCRKHYARNLRTGDPHLKIKEQRICNEPGCARIALCKALCCFHYKRKRRGIASDRPFGNKGELNPRWRGGTSGYKNHHQMKKIRLFILEMSDNTCYFCGGFATEIHHRDQSKDKHTMRNLVASCHYCNSRPENRTSKYKRIYGKTLLQISKDLNLSIYYVYKLHHEGKLKQKKACRTRHERSGGYE